MKRFKNDRDSITLRATKNYFSSEIGESRGDGGSNTSRRRRGLCHLGI
jgi:hypothetical protein